MIDVNDAPPALQRSLILNSNKGLVIDCSAIVKALVTGLCAAASPSHRKGEAMLSLSERKMRTKKLSEQDLWVNILISLWLGAAFLWLVIAPVWY